MKLSRSLEHWILNERFFALLHLRRVALSSSHAYGVVEFYVLGALR